MKKIITIAAICLFTITSYAQLAKGGWITTLQGSGSIKGNSAFNSSTFTFQPGVMKLIGNNLGLGINLSTTFERSVYPAFHNTEIVSKNKTFELETGAILRKYFGNYKFKPYVEFSSGLKHSQHRDYLDNSLSYEGNTNKMYYRPGIGISYWITDKVGLDINVNYDLNVGNFFSQYKDWRFNMGFSIKLGK